MSFLAPLYVLGLAAIALPVLFHLVRRMPRGRQPFGSLIFLAPSPPRLTRRSRLDNLLLLALRALALALVVLAFARPFVRAIAQLDVAASAARRIAIVVDTSASMRRAGLRQQAADEAEKVIRDLAPGDDAALMAFDAGLRTLVGFDDDASRTTADPTRKIAALRDALRHLAPGWQASDLGEALAAAADAVGDVGTMKERNHHTERLVVLISDLQQGSRLDGLANYQWPEDVRLVVRPLAAADPTNAGLGLAADLPGPPLAEVGRRLRVRVINNRDSKSEQFRLSWVDEKRAAPGASATAPIDVCVPAGESRIVLVPVPPDASAGRLVLSGDAHPFDNSLYVAPLEQEAVTVVYIGDDDADDVKGLRYYLQRAFPETLARKVRLTTFLPLSPSASLPASPLIVVGQAIPDQLTDRLGQYVRGGGTLLYVLRDAASAGTLSRLLGLFDQPGLAVEEAAGPDYAMLGEIDFAHPLFAPFADPRFSDFTKIHFWKHRRVVQQREVSGEGRAGSADAVVAARFDDGTPALVEWALGKGRLTVLAAGWHPADSELARSSKFVPLLSEVLDRAGGGAATLPQYVVGSRLIVPPAGGKSRLSSDPPTKAIVQKPDGSRVELGPGNRRFDQTDQPGLYRVSLGQSQRCFAVNLAAAESQTSPLDVDELQQHGLRLAQQQTRAQLAEKQRQMRDVEMEDRQKLWRWLLVAALAVLMLEIALAGHLQKSRESSVESPEQQPSPLIPNL